MIAHSNVKHFVARSERVKCVVACRRTIRTGQTFLSHIVACIRTGQFIVCVRTRVVNSTARIRRLLTSASRSTGARSFHIKKYWSRAVLRNRRPCARRTKRQTETRVTKPGLAGRSTRHDDYIRARLARPTARAHDITYKEKYISLTEAVTKPTHATRQTRVYKTGSRGPGDAS